MCRKKVSSVLHVDVAIYIWIYPHNTEFFFILLGLEYADVGPAVLNSTRQDVQINVREFIEILGLI